MKQDSEPISPPETPKRKHSDAESPKRKHSDAESPKRKLSNAESPKRKLSDAESPKPADDESEDTPIAKKRTRRNNPSVDKSESEMNRVASSDQSLSPHRISDKEQESNPITSLAVALPSSSKFVNQSFLSFKNTT